MLFYKQDKIDVKQTISRAKKNVRYQKQFNTFMTNQKTSWKIINNTKQNSYRSKHQKMFFYKKI